MNGIIIPLALGYLLGNAPAREKTFAYLQQMAGSGIDMLNGLNKNQGDANVSNSESED